MKEPMKHATAILIFLVLAIALLAYLLSDPVLFLAGMFLIPSIMQAIPWGLATDMNDGEVPEDEYNESKAGFLSQLKESEAS